MKLKRSLIALALTLSLLVSSATLTLSAISNGDKVGEWTVKNVKNEDVTSDGEIKYSYFEFDIGTKPQKIHTLEFNLDGSDYIPYLYSQYSGYGASVQSSAKDAESKYGVDVVAGINASFYSMPKTGHSANTYGGTNISDGKIIQGSSENGLTNLVVFQSDGSLDILESRVAYNIYHNGTELLNGTNTALQFINYCPADAAATQNGIYYYDTSCGNNTDTNTAGIEVVLKKQANTEISVGGILIGEVTKIRNTDKGQPVAKDEFVLYIKDGSPMRYLFDSVKVGDTFQIDARETVEASKAKMNTASSAFVVYTYFIVKNGVNTTDTNGLGEEFNNTAAIRTGFGIKKDGSIVLVASSNYITVHDFADLLIGMGCETAINLDGGGSTSMITENSSGDFDSKHLSTRRIANSLLIIRRPTVDPDLVNQLNNAISAAEASLSSEPNVALQQALDYAKSVATTPTSMSGDYTKALMSFTLATSDANALIESINKARTLNLFEYSLDALEQLWDAFYYAQAVSASPNSTTQMYVDARTALDDAIALANKGEMNVALGKSYTLKGLFIPSGGTTASYPDTNNCEMTDGIHGNSGYTDVAYLGLSYNASDVGADKLTNITVDLGEVTSVTKFSVYFVSRQDYGIAAPEVVKFYYSLDGSTYTLMGSGSYRGNTNPMDQTVHISDLTLAAPVSARYIKAEFQHYAGKPWVFPSEFEIMRSADIITPTDSAYITQFNKKIAAGDAAIFTSDVFTNLDSTANINWTQTAFCEWDDAVGGYRIVRVKSPDNKTDVLQPGQIAIAIHDAEAGGNDPSKANRAYLATNGIVGKYIEFYGIYVDTKTLLPGAHIKITSAQEFNAEYNGINTRSEIVIPPDKNGAVVGAKTLVPIADYTINNVGDFTLDYYFRMNELHISSYGSYPSISLTYDTPIVVNLESSSIFADFDLFNGSSSILLRTSGNQIIKLQEFLENATIDGVGDLVANYFAYQTIPCSDLKDMNGDALITDEYGNIAITSITIYAVNYAVVSVYALSVIGGNTIGVEDEYIYGEYVETHPQTAAVFMQGLSEGTIITDQYGRELTDYDQPITTGMKVRNGTDVFTIIIPGDLNKDGVASSIDYFMLRMYLLGKADMDETSIAATTILQGYDHELTALDYFVLRYYLINH